MSKQTQNSMISEVIYLTLVVFNLYVYAKIEAWVKLSNDEI